MDLSTALQSPSTHVGNGSDRHRPRRPRWAGRQPRSRHSSRPGAADQEREAIPSVCPLLRGRVRDAGPHRRRQDRQHRGQPASPHQPGQPLPEGRGDLPAPRQPEPADQGAAPRARRHRVGGLGRSTGRWTASPSWSRRRATRRSSSGCRTASSSTYAGDLLARRRDDGQRVEPRPAEADARARVVAIENQARI